MGHECVDDITFFQPIIKKGCNISISLDNYTIIKTQYEIIKQIASARIESSILICNDTNTHMILNCWSISVVSDVEQISISLHIIDDGMILAMDINMIVL